jgi:hypothetical protein
MQLERVFCGITQCAGTEAGAQTKEVAMFRLPKCCLVLLVKRRRIGGWSLLIRISIA